MILSTVMMEMHISSNYMTPFSNDKKYIFNFVMFFLSSNEENVVI